MSGMVFNLTIAKSGSQYSKPAKLPFFSNLFPDLLNSVIAQYYESDLPLRNGLLYLSYLVSPYGLVCMLMAVILNRTAAFASMINSRNFRNRASALRNANTSNNANIDNNKIDYPYYARFLLRSVVIWCLERNLYRILVALNCYSRPVNRIMSHTTLFNYEPIKEFKTYLSPVDYNVTLANEIYHAPIVIGKNGNINYTSHNFGIVGPSTAFLWPFFLSLCFSQFSDLLLSHITGSSATVDTSLTLFEFSLAFHEAQQQTSPLDPLARPTPELLAVCLVSCLNHLSVHILKSYDCARYKLAVLSVLNCSFLAYFFYSCFTNRLPYFPVMVIVSFVPQIIVLFIIAASCTIYFAAYLLTDRRNRKEMAFNNLGLENLNINATDDFTALLMKFGVIALATAAKKSYIQELSNIELPRSTWLDQEIENYEKSIQTEHANTDVSANQPGFDAKKPTNQSKYSNFLKLPQEIAELMKESQSKDGEKNVDEKSWMITKKTHKFLVIVRLFIKIIYALIFERNSLAERNQSLQRKRELLQGNKSSMSNAESKNTIPFFDDSTQEIDYEKLLHGSLAPENDEGDEFDLENSDSDDPWELDSEYESDFEVEERQPYQTTKQLREKTASSAIHKRDEHQSTSLIGEVFGPYDIYSFFTGVVQNHIPHVDLQNEGQDSSIRHLSISYDDEFKQILSCHLSRDVSTCRPSNDATGSRLDATGPITRSKFRTQSISGSLFADKDSNNDDEVAKLLKVIAERRKLSARHVQDNDEALDDYDEEDDLDNPMMAKSYSCVICQGHPRQIVLWPCQCLAICDQCRLSLSLRNFNSCVCCRTPISGYSKVFLP